MLLMLEKILDTSIYYSFDKSGFLRHQKSFQNPLTFNDQDKVLITGGTSGIGLACAKELIACSSVIVTGRSKVKASEAISVGAIFKQLDMIDWDKIDKFVDELPILSSVVLNAGGMPDKKVLNKYGVESQAASQLFGHNYLLEALVKKEKLKKGGKVIWVTSGGMYLKSLDLKDLIDPNIYDKVGVYANVKRAQVTLLNYLKEKFSDYEIAAMHPGWVDTPAVRESIPKFYEKTKHRLRSPLDGADTILWLLSDQIKKLDAALYFDRKMVKRHLFFFTKKSDAKLQELVKSLQSYYIS